MHKSSIDEMTAFRDKYLDRFRQLMIYDFGSRKIGNARTYRELFDCGNWTYSGIDMEPGENVDIVIDGERFTSSAPILPADVIISGQMLEHCKQPWEMVMRMTFCLNTGGLLCIIAPSSGPEHRYPIDCYRFLPDGMRALAEHAGLEVLDVHINNGKPKYSDGSSKWKDCVLIARK